MNPSPNISKSNVIGCEAKYELSKKRSQGFLSEIEVFGKYNHIMWLYNI